LVLDDHTVTSVFDNHNKGLTNGLESTPTAPGLATETPPPTRGRNPADSKERDATPSSVALSLVPAFQTPPPAPYPTLRERRGKRSAPSVVCIHDVATPSPLLPVEDTLPATVRPHRRLDKPRQRSGFPLSPPGCSSANPNRRRPPSAHPLLPLPLLRNRQTWSWILTITLGRYP
jgi:hypothetical protein